MLIRFVTSNFLSFNEEKEFNMLAGSFRTHKHHVYKAGKLNVLKGAAIYGANGAGKSNLVKAIDYLKQMVENGGLEKSVNSQKFKLDKTKANAPVEFEIEFYYKRKIYAYGVSVNGNVVEKEWLYISGIDKEDKLVFERKTLKSGKSNVKLGKSYIKTKKDELLIELMEDNLLLSDELLIGKTENLNIVDIENVREWMRRCLWIIYPYDKKIELLLKGIGLHPQLMQSSNELIKTFDIGISELLVKKISFNGYFGSEDDKLVSKLIDLIEQRGHAIFYDNDGNSLLAVKENDTYMVKKMMSRHASDLDKMIEFDLAEESDGTRRLMEFIPVVGAVLEDNLTCIIDEIDQSLHPELLQTLVKKIMDEPNTKGQLIFTTHESNLLDLNIFRQDEIWFAEKDKGGATNLYSLSEFKPRYDLDIRKGYLKGRFGAVPFTADLKKLNWQEIHA